MFLVTTADQRYWNKGEKILFLGEWCKIFDQRHVWTRLNYQVLPYHWNNRHKLYQDYLYLQAVCERYLKHLAERLNGIHQVDHSIRYWRIILGPWLFHFVQALYDRYLSICKAAESSVTHTWIAEQTAGCWIPNDFNEFVGWAETDEYNHHLYGYLIKALGRIEFETRELGSSRLNADSGAASGWAPKHVARTFLHQTARLIPDRWNKVVFVSSYLDRSSLIRLQSSLGQLPYLATPTVLSPVVSVDHAIRGKLTFNAGDDCFESLLDGLIAEQIPKTYLEGYVEMARRAIAAYPKRPKVIFTANPVTDEGFKFWTARNTELGTRLVISQHGGHYGSARWSAFEDHEIKISDRYFTWGWEMPAEPRAIPMSAGKVTKVRESWRPDAAGTILWVALSISRYSTWLYSGPLAPQMLDYLEEQYRFARNVSPAVHSLLLLRLNPHDYGWNEMSRWKEIDLTLKCYQGRTPLEKHVNQSRLMIATYNATTYLETFAANFPTLIFWNPEQWEIRQAAQPFFDELRVAGILHNTPESAAAKVNEIYQDPQSWWRLPAVQKAKDRFCKEFVRTSRDWLPEWKTQLLEEAGISG